MRAFYTLMWRLALPLVLLRLWLRGRKEPGYRQHWGERLGWYRDAAPAGGMVLWVHAVSVGETRAAEPLIDALLAHYPGSRIILTHMTPTGRATGKALYAKHGARLSQAYLPYDIPGMLRRFIRRHQPRVCILMETEVWPNLIAVSREQGVPVMLANARLSERSLRKAGRFGGLLPDAARAITLVAAQTGADAERIRSLGAPRVEVTGSIKFDVVVPQAALDTGAALRAAIGPRPVLLCASTREGEEELILDAWLAARAALPDGALLMLVPRHPQRFGEVEKMIGARSLAQVRRSALALDGSPLAAGVQVLLGDSMGEMFAYYAACDVAFVGGSLPPLGAHSPIEPAALGKPILIGPHTFNFAVAIEDALAAGGAIQVQDAAGLMAQATRLLRDGQERAAMGQRALAFAAQHRGATARTLALLPSLIR
ncbi:lipid IV(A) 3-deoxy-D-manno-octulosonic acid transferase [Oxalobacteraceae bacterium A2-2]